jgi:hypothetical protein
MKPAFLLIATAASLVACQTSKPTGTEGGTRVTLQPGQQQTPINGIHITLIKVENESRCPTNVQCVWQGDAEVTVGISTNALDLTAPVVLHTGIEPRSTVRNGYLFRLDSLTPYPRSGVPIAQGDYRAWMTVRFLPD